MTIITVKMSLGGHFDLTLGMSGTDTGARYFKVRH